MLKSDTEWHAFFCNWYKFLPTAVSRMSFIIDSMQENDWPAVKKIYQQGIATGQATFASAPPESWQDWTKGRINACSLVARQNLHIGGWAALSPVSDRCVYAGVAEVSVYVAAEQRGQGLGGLLLAALIERSEQHGIWTLQAGIFPENRTSLDLHEKYGFRTVGRREKLGRMEYGPLQGRWRDVLLLERRSQTIGRD